MNNRTTLQDAVTVHLEGLYGSAAAAAWEPRFTALLYRHAQHSDSIRTGVRPRHPIDSHHCVLITYGDSILPSPGDSESSPLCVLERFLRMHAGEALSTVHILPFCPSTSDDGFSVSDPCAVDPSLGTWNDLELLGKSFRLMYDLVANHVSRSNPWIAACARGDRDFADFCIVRTGDEDIGSVFRPRTLPLFSPLTIEGKQKEVWTTFSSDQIDLNYHNPGVLLAMVGVLLTYAERGASVIRLDAVAFIWKESGTSCIHHPKTHAIIRFFRWILDTFHPGCLLITETNVPHAQNISYFGNGHDEASLVYNFPLPPLVLHTFLTQDAAKLSAWAASLKLLSEDTAFFNFLASHDGIGVVPAEGILSAAEIEALARHVVSRGGFVSRKSNGDGSTSPYELNCNYYSALTGMIRNDTEDAAIGRFLAANAIMLVLKGVPGLYIHSLIGSENWINSPDLLLQPRRINREKITVDRLERDLSDPHHRRSRILGPLTDMLCFRKEHPALRASALQSVLRTAGPGIFTLVRHSDHPRETMLCLINVTASRRQIPREALTRETEQASGSRLSRPPAVWTYPSLDGRTGMPDWLSPYQIVFCFWTGRRIDQEEDMRSHGEGGMP